MDVSVGTGNVTSTQKRLLEKNRQGRGSDLLSDLWTLTHDDDITAGREEVHPDWVEIFESNKKSLQRIAPPAAFKELVSFFEPLSRLDAGLRTVDPSSLNLTFLLGAGASKPKPSDIPTVKELLPQLLERARRLDREDVTRLAEFCERRKIDNIEDLLTAAQLSTFCSRNPTVLRLMDYLLYRSDSDEDDARVFRQGLTGRIVARRPRDPATDLSSIAFLQDTLQVLFGLLASTNASGKTQCCACLDSKVRGTTCRVLHRNDEL